MENTNYIFMVNISDISGSLIRVLQVFTRRNCRICSFDVRDGRTINIEACNITKPQHVKSQLEKLVNVSSVDVLKRQ